MEEGKGRKGRREKKKVEKEKRGDILYIRLFLCPAVAPRFFLSLAFVVTSSVTPAYRTC
jgi:hypothetical protein